VSQKGLACLPKPRRCGSGVAVEWITSRDTEPMKSQPPKPEAVVPVTYENFSSAKRRAVSTGVRSAESGPRMIPGPDPRVRIPTKARI
jgi:hypothetical protein